MTAIDLMPYSIAATAVLASLLCPLFIGLQGFIVTAAVLPFAIAYLVFDRALKRREAEQGGGAH